jgi:hypothetical protein
MTSVAKIYDTGQGTSLWVGPWTRAWDNVLEFKAQRTRPFIPWLSAQVEELSGSIDLTIAMSACSGFSSPVRHEQQQRALDAMTLVRGS